MEYFNTNRLSPSTRCAHEDSQKITAMFQQKNQRLADTQT